MGCFLQGTLNMQLFIWYFPVIHSSVGLLSFAGKKGQVLFKTGGGKTAFDSF